MWKCFANSKGLYKCTRCVIILTTQQMGSQRLPSVLQNGPGRRNSAAQQWVGIVFLPALPLRCQMTMSAKKRKTVGANKPFKSG